jgi:hypothetical protein
MRKSQHNMRAAKHYCAARFPSDLWKQIGILGDTLEVLLDDSAKFCPSIPRAQFHTARQRLRIPFARFAEGQWPVSSAIRRVEFRFDFFQGNDVIGIGQMILETAVNEFGFTRRQVL